MAGFVNHADKLRQLTDVDAEEDVALSLGGLEVVDLVVDLEPPDAAHEAGGGVQEVTCVRRFAMYARRMTLDVRSICIYTCLIPVLPWFYTSF